MPDTFPASHDTAPAPLQKRELSLTFSGTGGEYFRIWIVNLLLTIVTFGIYSAWAKVRRLQYFDRNTVLDGAAFDFHGNPVAILKGRILALVMVSAYQFAFGFSLTAGLLVFGVLMLVLPWLLRGALRFRLHNTSWRGLRFGFTGTTQGAYAAFIPPMLMVMWPALMVASMGHGTNLRKPSPLFALVFLLYLAWPVMHAWIKRYQHANVRFGGADSVYTLKTARFWKPYLVAFLLMFGVVGLIGVASAILVPLVTKSGANRNVVMGSVFAMIALGYIIALSAIPYVQARIGNLVWSYTSFPGVKITSNLTFRGLFKLHLVNVILTLLTIGLFRPFALVRTQRYILEHMHVSTSIDLDELIDAGHGANVSAAGDGAADFAGFDFAL